jgi:hypothetical protein
VCPASAVKSNSGRPANGRRDQVQGAETPRAFGAATHALLTRPPPPPAPAQWPSQGPVPLYSLSHSFHVSSTASCDAPFHALAPWPSPDTDISHRFSQSSALSDLLPSICTDFPRKASLVVLLMEAVQTSETLVNSYQSTRRYNPEDSHLHSHRCGNLKSYRD